ncbi:Carbonic anhydrase 2 [Trichinella spiralis]|uniref:Carbonic anhydrase n=1 Tax=Trichinella spiralis TaxID=6334 RepID=A0A0V1BC16_TRISP|nr:Carbonic anhydrase 2 [Trichinella spiralis]
MLKCLPMVNPTNFDRSNTEFHFLRPKFWSKSYPLANGSAQSPVDITNCISDDSLPESGPIIHYQMNDLTSIFNTGTTWQLKCATDNIVSEQLSAPYKLKQIHAHWGTNATDGSEHTINGKRYAAEIHLVHWNTNYSTIEEAVNYRDGVNVLAVLVEESSTENVPLQPLIKFMRKIPEKNDTYTIEEPFDATALLPNVRNYFTYEGSLTTPPCNECVIWTIFQTPIAMSSSQVPYTEASYLDAFRSLKTCCETLNGKRNILCNVRPVQPLNGRLVRCNRKCSK